MKLEMGSPTLNNGDVELTPQQQRASEITQGTANVGVIEQKLEAVIEKNDVLAQYPAEIQTVLKDALIQECYIKYGEHPEIRSIGEGVNPTTQDNYIQVQVGDFLYASIHPNKVIAEYAQQNPDFDLEGLRTNLAEHAQKVEAERTFTIEKDALQSAFQAANNERLTAVLERYREIENAGFVDKILGRVPDPIPNVGEQPLSKEEILKHVDPQIATSETFQKMLDAMVTRLDSYKEDIVDPSFWDTDAIKLSLASTASNIVDTVEETAKLGVALAEGTVVGGVNLFAEGFQGAGALGVGAGVAIANWDVDKGLDAFRGTFETLREQHPDIPLSEFSTNVLGTNKGMQWIGGEIQYRVDDSIRAATEMWGEDAGQFVGDGISALGKVVGLGFARVPLNRTVRVGSNTVDYAYTSARSVFTPKDPNRVIRVTQFYDPAKGNFPIDGRFALHSKPSGIGRIVDGAKGDITWVAPFAADKMNTMRRIMTGVGDRTHYVEFSVKASELANPGGVKWLTGHYQKIINGSVDISATGRAMTMGVAEVNPIGNKLLGVGTGAVITGSGYKIYYDLSKD